MNTYRNKVLDWLDYYDCDWEHFVTLTFTQNLDFDKRTSIDIATREFDKFARRLKNKILGKKSRRIYEMLPFMELTKADRPHFHVLFSPQDKYTADELRLLVMELWNEVKFTSIRHLKNGENPGWFKTIRHGTQKDTIKYSLKTLEMPEVPEMTGIIEVDDVPEIPRILENSIDFVFLDYLYRKKFEGYIEPKKPRHLNDISMLLQRIRATK